MNAPGSPASPPLLLPPLPYADDGLAPWISKNTLSFHHGKHHRAYVDNLNKLLAGTERADWPLEKVVRAAAGSATDTAVFNNAAQAWNHAFYWKSLRPRGGGIPPAISRLAAGNSVPPLWPNSGAGGPGWWKTAAASKSLKPPTPTRR